MKNVLLIFMTCMALLTISGQVMTLSDDTKAYSAPDGTSEEKHAFSKGETVYVLEGSDGWYQIFYQGEKLYIPKDSMTDEDVEESLQQARELAEQASEEIKEAEKRDVIELETYAREWNSKRNALIWKFVIVFLMVSIIIVSVIIGITNSKKDKEDK